MFDTTHDAVLLVFAALYVLVALARAIQIAGLSAHMQARIGRGWVSVPALIATTLALVAVSW